MLLILRAKKPDHDIFRRGEVTIRACVSRSVPPSVRQSILDAFVFGRLGATDGRVFGLVIIEILDV